MVTFKICHSIPVSPGLISSEISCSRFKMDYRRQSFNSGALLAQICSICCCAAAEACAAIDFMQSILGRRAASSQRQGSWFSPSGSATLTIQVEAIKLLRQPKQSGHLGLLVVTVAVHHRRKAHSLSHTIFSLKQSTDCQSVRNRNNTLLLLLVLHTPTSSDRVR